MSSGSGSTQPASTKSNVALPMSLCEPRGRKGMRRLDQPRRVPWATGLRLPLIESCLAASNLKIHRAREFVQHFDLHVFVNDQRIGRDAVSEEHVRADGGAFADDGVAAHDGRAGINRHVIFNGRMAFLAAQHLAARERTRHQTYVLFLLDLMPEWSRSSHDLS